MNNKGRGDIAQSSQAKGKETMSVELSGDVHSKAKKSDFNNQEFKFPPKQYSFKDEQVVAIFHVLYKGNKLKLLMIDALMKWDARMIPTIASCIEWFIILQISALSSRIKFKL